MLSKRQLKLIRSLALKKHRDETRLFVAEGAKVVGDLMPHFDCAFLGMTVDFARRHPGFEGDETAELTQAELERASFLQTPRDVIAVFHQPQTQTEGLEKLPQGELCLALDAVQDPGNLGTIIRIADWFGVSHVFCSPTTADVFATKVVQATMGALARVRAHYVDLPAFLKKLEGSSPVYGTFLDGTDLYSVPLSRQGIIVMGNEGNGISPAVEPLVTQRLFIPSYPPGQPTSESLNVAVATAVTCAEFRRRAGNPHTNSPHTSGKQA